MTTNETNCETIQETIALAHTLTQAQKAHLATCTHCQRVQQQMQQLDSLVEQATQDLVPQGFVERVMARLPGSTPSLNSESLLGEKLLAMVSRSRLLQTLLLGLGMVVGITHIVRFFVSIFIASMAAAF